jgi:hypothetical protein
MHAVGGEAMRSAMKAQQDADAKTAAKVRATGREFDLRAARERARELDARIQAHKAAQAEAEARQAAAQKQQAREEAAAAKERQEQRKLEQMRQVLAERHEASIKAQEDARAAQLLQESSSKLPPLSSRRAAGTSSARSNPRLLDWSVGLDSSGAVAPRRDQKAIAARQQQLLKEEEELERRAAAKRKQLQKIRAGLLKTDVVAVPGVVPAQKMSTLGRVARTARGARPAVEAIGSDNAGSFSARVSSPPPPMDSGTMD